MDFSTGLLVLLFVIFALFTGAFVRHILKGTQVPYTVALLLLGIAIGLLQRADVFQSEAQAFGESLALIAEIDSHLFLYLFLPTLIFESAFAMEVHLFRRMFTQIALLAVPGLMLAIWLTAELIFAITPDSWQWSWAICLMFGALISATDPVAVVALLKEVSSRKRLETLIEGESLLNDGTAIVFFSLFFTWVTATFSGAMVDGITSPLHVTLEFVKVVLVGLIIGLVVGWLCILWIERVFNDPMIEISLTIAAAYSVFFIAENFHVSGVVAVVTLAIIFASIGRTRISPEVAGFLHHFWEMMAHMANTLIFLLVGILVAIRVPLNDIQAWQMLFVLYGGILVIRAISITVFMPALKRLGIGINFAKAAVLCWGGLRGAVSLALALAVVASDIIPKEIGDRVLFLCAGIVVLTILVNGSTMSLLLKLLGLNSLPPAKQATVDKAQTKISAELHSMLPVMMTNEFLKGADWEVVKQKAQLQLYDETIDNESISEHELNVAYKRRLLETERKHYWTQFEQGMLSKQATSKLVEAVEAALDGEPCIGPRTFIDKTWQVPSWFASFRSYQWLNRLLLKFYFNKLALGYDIARGFIHAQEALESHIHALAPNESSAEAVMDMVDANKKNTLEKINALRESFPEIIQSLQSQAATRMLLNRERAVITEQLKQAVLDKPEAQRLLMSVEDRMQALQKQTIFKSTQEQRLVNDIPWARSLCQETREQLSTLIEHNVYETGQTICKTGQPLNKIGIVSRGSVKEHWSVMNNEAQRQICTNKGPGESIALLALFTSMSNTHCESETPCDVMWIPCDKLKQLMQKDNQLTLVVCKLMKDYSI
ncbi:cation:proton antiporter [Pseudoalteromonas luteoviolacea]|nr:cation:proton antiporter [Pseudoalteromonas luteoviolacea]